MAKSQSRRSRRHTTSPVTSTTINPMPRYWPENGQGLIAAEPMRDRQDLGLRRCREKEIVDVGSAVADEVRAPDLSGQMRRSGQANHVG